MSHQHRVKTSRDVCFTGPIASAKENRAAHGNITQIDTCQCGAKRKTNINGLHTERGQWFLPPTAAEGGVQ
jgi:hypothetical protein